MLHLRPTYHLWRICVTLQNCQAWQAYVIKTCTATIRPLQVVILFLVPTHIGHYFYCACTILFTRHMGAVGFIDEGLTCSKDPDTLIEQSLTYSNRTVMVISFYQYSHLFIFQWGPPCMIGFWTLKTYSSQGGCSPFFCCSTMWLDLRRGLPHPFTFMTWKNITWCWKKL